MSVVVEVTSLDELDGLDGVWDSLLSRMPQTSFFQSLDWLRCYWRHFGDRQSLRVMLVGDRDAIHGIVPLTLRPVQTLSGHLNALEFAGSERHNWGGPIGPHPGMTMSSVAKFLRKRRTDWDVVSLRSVDWGNDKLRAFQQACRFSGWQINAAPLAQIREVVITPEVERGTSPRPPVIKHGPRIRGDFSYARFRPDTTVDSTDTGWDFVEMCNAVLGQHTHRSDDDRRERNFFEDVHVDAVRLGKVDIGVLSSDGKPVAFHYGFHSGLDIDELITEHAANFPVRDILMQRLVEDSRSRGDRSYRFVDESPRRVLTRNRVAYAIESKTRVRRHVQKTNTATWAIRD